MNTQWKIPRSTASLKERLSPYRFWCRNLLLYLRDVLRDASLYLFPDVRRARRYRKLAFQSEELGDLEPAIEFFTEAAQTFSERGLMRRAVDCYEELCDLYIHLGSTNEALGTCRRAIQVAGGRAKGWNGAYCNLVLSSMLGDLGLHSEAIAFLQSARKVFEHENTEYYTALIDSGIASHLLNSGGEEEAKDLLISSASVFERLCDEENLMFCQGMLAELYRHLGDNDRAELYRDALRSMLAKKGKQWLANIEDPFLFDICRSADGAIDGYNWLMDSDGGYTRRLWGYFDTSGFYSRLLGDTDRAQASFRRSVKSVEIMRSNLSRRDLRVSLLEKAHDAYYDVITAALEAGDTWTALEYLEKLKSRDLFEMMSLRQGTRDHSGATEYSSHEDACSRTAFIDTVQGALSSTSTAMVLLFPTEHKTIVVVAASDQGHVNLSNAAVDYTFEQVMSHVQGLSEMTRAGSKDSLFDYVDSLLSQLSEQLYVAIRELLPDSAHEIIFVPFSGFHLLPLHAMYVKENGRRQYVSDRCMVRYAPSLKILTECRARERLYGRAAFVASANPRHDLAYSPSEAEGIAHLLGAEACRRVTRNEFVQRGLNAQIIHYTGHADGNGLILHGIDGTGPEDCFEVGDIFSALELPQAWLVTLGACETGKVRLGKTDEYIGLPSAFLYAGASTVICSLWPVSDASTTLLMAKMYRLMIRDGKGKAESLREAQRWLKNPKNRTEHLQELEKLVPWLKPTAGNPLPDASRFRRSRPSLESLLPEDLSHPYYWAGFICTGAP